MDLPKYMEKDEYLKLLIYLHFFHINVILSTSIYGVFNPVAVKLTGAPSWSINPN